MWPPPESFSWFWAPQLLPTDLPQTHHTGMRTKPQEPASPTGTLLHRKDVVKASKLLAEVTGALEPHRAQFDMIRCLALGSPTQDAAAGYQLALLCLIADHFGIEYGRVSLFDPVFSQDDFSLFGELGLKVEPELATATTTALYFMPHADLSLTNDVVTSQAPRLLLANNLISHTSRLGKLDLFRQYPVVSKLVHQLEQAGPAAGAVDTGAGDGFQVVRKKTRRNNKLKLKFTEPEIDYNEIDMKYSDITLTPLTEVSGQWNNAFTDLAFHSLAWGANR